jgi:hypothetical protein
MAEQHPGWRFVERSFASTTTICGRPDETSVTGVEVRRLVPAV